MVVDGAYVSCSYGVGLCIGCCNNTRVGDGGIIGDGASKDTIFGRHFSGVVAVKWWDLEIFFFQRKMLISFLSNQGI